MTCKYLGYKEYTENNSSEDVEKTSKHSSISIKVITEQHSTNDHYNNYGSGDIDDDSNVFCIVESLDLDFSRFEG